jgi:hypothetical protein
VVVLDGAALPLGVVVRRAALAPLGVVVLDGAALSLGVVVRRAALAPLVLERMVRKGDMVDLSGFTGRKVEVTFVRPVILKGVRLRRVIGVFDGGEHPGICVLSSIESAHDPGGLDVTAQLGLGGMSIVFNAGNVDVMAHMQ